jgi:putative membrane protein
MISRKILAGFAVLMMTVSGATMSYAATDAEKSAEAAHDAQHDAGKNDKANSKMTKKFVETASAAGMFEIDSSKIALEKSSNDQIKQFAQQMVDDHSKAADALKAAASEDQKVYLSDKETKDQVKEIEKLNKADAKDFDKEYVKAQVKAHDEAVDLFKKYSEKGDDAELKEFATNTLPTLQHHKTMIDDIHSSMK